MPFADVPFDICQPAISPVNCIVTVVLNVLTDLCLMYIPLKVSAHVLVKARNVTSILMTRLQVISTSQLDIKRKVMLSGLFSGGIFVMACGILRAALILTDPVGGAAAAGSWAVRETFVAVIIGNLLMVYALGRNVSTTIHSKMSAVTSSRSSHIELVEEPGQSSHKAFAGEISADKRASYWYDIRANPTSSENTSELRT